ncbi:hypothetical protein A1O1_02620 [Capronia coronata CBS 617.96]|uniref:Uncharacterized protein n=1 Tax=Capronia coronata CBS 617.96 TaxID=1182541 RepID=W9YMS4_9EURO|nr:uncharacterized protein A1O1_02620 [Capronia coronata CBS 617.96]EXJ94227.1 hypothetical protein A1O1_02620 [Capronia coronata CBS 617.96]
MDVDKELLRNEDLDNGTDQTWSSHAQQDIAALPISRVSHGRAAVVDADTDMHMTASFEASSDGGREAEADADAETQLEQINAVLDAIRLNIANILRTWGRDSSQYRSAVGIMQGYLVQNMERLRHVAGSSSRYGADVDVAGTGGEKGLVGEGNMGETSRQGQGDMGKRIKEIEGGIELLMSELKLE